MKSSNSFTMLAFAALAMLAGPLAIAAESGWYIGGNGGRSETDVDEDRIAADLLEQGFTTNFMDDNERDTGFKVFGGYQFNKYWAMESGYYDLGDFGFTSFTAPPGTLHGVLGVRGLNLDAVLSLPFTEKFSAFGRAGVAFSEVEGAFESTGLVTVLEPDSEKRAANYKFGVGLQYDFTRRFGMRLEAERYRIDDSVGNRGDVDLFSAGVLLRFGGASPPPVVQAPLPPPPPEVAKPVVVAPAPVPPPITTERYCSLLEFQFEINQHQVRREEKEKLAVIGKFLVKYPNTQAEIEGHTDSVGTDEKNQILSQRRADAVVAYLEQNFDIRGSRLSAVGYGESRPIADNATEEGKRANRRISAIVDCATDVEGLSVRPARTTMALAMEFDAKDASVRPEYRDELRDLADFLKANPRVTATVEGHTGNLQATPERALEISQERAQNVVNYLVENFGVERSRLSAQGFGQTRRSAYNTTAEGRQENRRVNVIINYPR
ncbi:MAG: OmpA family protein [Pseudomonadota bacterium]